MDEEPILLSFESVVKFIRSSSKGTSCGEDNFPIDILKQLSKTVVKKEFPVEMRTFLKLLTAFFNRVFTFGHCPSEVLHFYDAGELIRLLQGNQDPAYREGNYIPDDCRHCPAVTASGGAAGGIRGHPIYGASFGVERMQNALTVHLSHL